MEICNIDSCGEIAGLRLAERRLLERERHYHDILHNLSDAIYLVEVTEDGRFRYLETNRTFETMMEVAEDGMLGKTVGEALRSSGAEASAEDAVAKFRRCIEIGSAISGEITLDTPSGLRILNSTLTPLFDGSGRINRILGISRDVTESKRTERLNDFLKFALDQAGDAVFLIDPANGHCFRYVNDQACRSLGYSRDELLSMTVQDIDPAADLEVVRKVDEHILTQAFTHFETYHRRKDGPIFPVEISVTAIEYDGQTMSLAIVRDISERKRAELALMASERMLSEAQAIAKLGSWDWDVVKNRVEWSDMAYDIYTPDQRPAAPGYEEFKQSVHPDDLERVDAAVRSAFEHYTPFDIEHRVVSQSKGVRTVHAQANVFRDRNGKPIRMVGTVQDITERKRIELDRKRLTEILEESPDFVGTVDMQGKLGYHNLAARRMVGLPDDADVSKLRISDMHPEWVTKLIMETALPFARAQGIWRGETALLHRNGGEISVQQTIMLHRDANGKPIRMSTIMQDISERKHLEEQLRLKEFALDHAQDAVYLMIPNGRFAYVNDQACRALGYSRDELLNLTPFDIDPDITPESNHNLQEEVQAQGGSITFETRHKRRDGSVFPVEIRGSRFDYQGQVFLLALVRDISERKQMEQERQSHLHFFESMDRVNRAIQGSTDLVTVLNEALDAMLAIFNCDRAFLCHPCDPGADTWSVPFEKAKPEFPGALALGAAIPMDAEVATTFRILLDADGPVTQGAGNQHPLPNKVSATFGFKSQISMAFYPKGDKPWHFGIQQCSRTRAWTADEQKLFQGIGRRLADALTGLLAYRNLQTSEREFRTLAENLPDYISRYDLKARKTYANPKLQQLLGGNIEAWLGKTPKEVDTGGEYDAYQAKLQGTLTTGACDELELILPDGNGSKLYFYIRFVPEYGPEGEMVGALAIGRDVTRKRELELELIRNERKFRTLVKNSPGFIGRFDTELRRTYVNQVYQDATKTSEDEVLGKTPLEYWPLASPNAEEFCTILRRVMTTRQQEWTEAHAVTATGSVRYFSMHMVPEFDDDGAIDGVLTTGIEITAMKNAERLKVEAREDERQMLARELHDDLGQRLTALRLDIAALELRFAKGNPDLTAKIRDMDAAVGETVKIVRSLLSMLRPAVLDTGLFPALEWLADEFRKRAHVECRLLLPKQYPALNEPQSIAIFRIVQESLTNVVKYAEANKVSIALMPEDGGYRLEIQDDGKGFDPDAIKQKGSFGLKGIEERVQMLGGKLTVAAAPGRGVKVTVQLPM